MSSASTSRATGSASIFDARIRQSTQIMNQPILLTIFSLFFSDFFMYQPNLSSSPLIFFQTFMHRRFPRVTLSLQPEYLQRTPFPLSPCPQTRIPDNHAVLENRSKKPSKTTLRVPAPLESCPPPLRPISASNLSIGSPVSFPFSVPLSSRPEGRRYNPAPPFDGGAVPEFRHRSRRRIRRRHFLPPGKSRAASPPPRF